MAVSALRLNDATALASHRRGRILKPGPVRCDSSWCQERPTTVHAASVYVGVSARRWLPRYGGFAMSQSVLIVEDCAPIAAILGRHLESAGYRTLVAYDGQ